MSVPPVVLAQTSAVPTLDVLFWLGVILLGAIVVIVLGLVARRLVNGAGDRGQTPSAFTLSDLRRLHAQGELTDEEFIRAKAGIIAAGLSRLRVDDAEAVVDNKDAHEPPIPPDQDAEDATQNP